MNGQTIRTLTFRGTGRSPLRVIRSTRDIPRSDLVVVDSGILRLSELGHPGPWNIVNLRIGYYVG